MEPAKGAAIAVEELSAVIGQILRISRNNTAWITERLKRIVSRPRAKPESNGPRDAVSEPTKGWRAQRTLVGSNYGMPAGKGPIVVAADLTVTVSVRY